MNTANISSPKMRRFLDALSQAVTSVTSSLMTVVAMAVTGTLQVTGVSTLTGGVTIGGGVIRNVTDVAAATYDLLATDDIVGVSYTATAAVTSLTLPSAQVVAGRTITIKDTGALAGTNNITIDTEGADDIDGADTYVMDANYECIELFCDGTNWFITNRSFEA